LPAWLGESANLVIFIVVYHFQNPSELLYMSFGILGTLLPIVLEQTTGMSAEVMQP